MPRARYTNTEVDVDVEAPSGGILLLNDVCHPWWRATVDGKPREILKADVIFRAVSVPPGRHMVRFTFHPLAGAFAEITEKLSRAVRWRPAQAPDFTYSCQASTEHFEQCAEFALLGNRRLGLLAVTVLSISLAESQNHR
jgi:hypothetical protein